MKGFIDFIREQGVIGLAIGFILGGAVSKVVTSLVNDIISPVIGLGAGRAGQLEGRGFDHRPGQAGLGQFCKHNH